MLHELKILGVGASGSLAVVVAFGALLLIIFAGLLLLLILAPSGVVGPVLLRILLPVLLVLLVLRLGHDGGAGVGVSGGVSDDDGQSIGR